MSKNSDLVVSKEDTQDSLAFTRFLASYRLLEPYNEHQLNEPISFIKAILAEHVASVNSNFFSKKKSREEKLFASEFIEDLTHLLIALSIHRHQETLLTSPQDFTTITPLLNNEAACNILFNSFKEEVWNRFLSTSSGRIPWKQEGALQNKLKKTEQLKNMFSNKTEDQAWFTQKSETLCRIILDSTSNFINTIQIRSLPAEADQAVVKRGSEIAFAKMWRKIETERSTGKRLSLNDGNDPTVEELNFAETITTVILGRLPYALITKEDNASLIKTIFRKNQGLTLKKLADNIGRHIPLESKEDAITKLLTNQHRLNMDAYLLYVLTQGGEAKFCPPPSQPEAAPESEVDAGHPTAVPVEGVKAEEKSEQALEANAEAIPEEDPKTTQRRFALERIKALHPNAVLWLTAPIPTPELSPKMGKKEGSPNVPKKPHRSLFHKDSTEEHNVSASPPRTSFLHRGLSFRKDLTEPGIIQKLKGLAHLHKEESGEHQADKKHSPTSSPEISPKSGRKTQGRPSRENAPTPASVPTVDTEPRHRLPRIRRSRPEKPETDAQQGADHTRKTISLTRRTKRSQSDNQRPPTYPLPSPVVVDDGVQRRKPKTRKEIENPEADTAPLLPKTELSPLVKARSGPAKLESSSSPVTPQSSRENLRYPRSSQEIPRKSSNDWQTRRSQEFTQESPSGSLSRS